MASLSSVSKDFSRSVLYSRQKRLAAVAQVCNTPRLATNRGSETVSLLMRRLHTNLRHAVQKRALAGSQCLHACSHSRQNLHDEGQDDQARHSTRDLLPACNVVGAVPMPCAYHLFCNCWCAVTSRVHAERTPSEDDDKAIGEAHTDAPLRIGMPLGTSIGKDCVSRSLPYAVQKRHEALLDSTTQLSALRNF